MGIQVLPEGQGGFASSFGNALGQGVAQQLPEEIKRYRLKSGLENVATKNIQDPYQLISQLATVPGLDPGLLGVLAPVLQSQIARNQAIPPGTPFPNENSPSGIPNPVSPSPKLSPQGSAAPEVEPLNELATNLLRYQPLNYPNIQTATAEAERRIGKLESELEKQFSSFLQKGKELQEGEIGGEVLDLMRQKAIQELATSGASERSIAQKYARMGKEIAKEYGAIRKIHSDTGIWNRSEQKTINSLRDSSKKLSNLGVPEEEVLDRLQHDLNISRAAASYIFNPLDETKAGRFIHKAPGNPALNILKNKLPGKSSDLNSPETKLAKEVAPLITDEDLIGSLAYIVRSKGYDWKRFISALQNELPENRVTTSQARDLKNQSLIPTFRPLDEIALLGFSGETKKARQSK